MMRFLRKLLPKRYNPLHWRKIAYRDTHGLRNRAWLLDTAAVLYEQKRKSWDFLLIYIDLRNFRAVNNQHSHADGNEVLKTFYALLESKFRTHKPSGAYKFQRNCPEKDIMVVREGGDEFVVFLPLGVSDDRKLIKAKKAISSRLRGLKIEHKGIEVTARVAIAESRSNKPFANFEEYLDSADQKLSAIHRSEH